ncbi:MAG TPA: hypothetical protein VEX11_10875, partial [Acetobacteraceae bacterium]|nr:hypothetical protein [Acetobacteraceae bacterium]
RKVSPDGILPGSSYREFDSAVGRDMRGTTNGDLRYGLGELRDTLRNAMDDSIGPEDAAAWREARNQYRNLMIAGRAASGAGSDAAEGLISPLALKGAVDATMPRDRRAFDSGPMRDLARLGQSVLRAPPDSGTAGRTLANNLLTGSLSGGGALAGFSTAGPIGGAVGALTPFVLPPAVQAFINSPAGRRWLMGQLPAGYAPAAAAGSASLAAEAARNRD